MEHGFDQFLTVGTYVFFRKKNFQFINLLKIENFSGLKNKYFFPVCAGYFKILIHVKKDIYKRAW